MAKARRPTVATWFKSHPKARKRVEGWLSSRSDAGGCSSGKPTGIRTLIAELRKRHRYPFTEHTSLMRWMRLEFGDVTYTAATAKRTPATFHRSASDVKQMERREDFIISCAVNNCDVQPGFLGAMKVWREERQGVIGINPVRYTNPTRRAEMDEDEGWAEELDEYMLESPLYPGADLAILPAKIQATTNNPLPTRVSGFTRGRSAIFGHPQLMMRSIAKAPGQGLASLLYSSGAVTKKDYSDTVTGDVGDFHHTHAAVIAEVRGDDLFMREVTWDGKGFYDCERYYTENGVEEDVGRGALLALALGDIHCPAHDPNVMHATFWADDSLYNVMRPEHLILHDLSDARPVCPHDMHKQLTLALRAQLGLNNAMRDAQAVAQFLNLLPQDCKTHVVASNHNDFWMRWLEGGEKGVLPENRKLYHWLSHELLDIAERDGAFPDALEVLLRGKAGLEVGNVTFHSRHESMVLARKVELLLHGDKGANGARGSARGISQLAGKFMIGHGHGPIIYQGVYMGGILGLLEQGYNIGPSGWRQTHVGQLRNGYRQMYHTLNGRWRG